MAASFPTSRPPLRSKFSECYTALLSGQQPWILDASDTSTGPSSRPELSRGKSSGKSNSGPRTRYFADLLCLSVETRLVVELLDAVSPDTLLDDDPNSQGALIRENVGSLWREAIRIWRQDDEDEFRRRNAVDTLVALSYPLLGKRFANYAFDIIAIFAGGMEEADDVFIALVDSIDDALRGHRPRRTALASSVRDENDEVHQARLHNAAYLDRELQHRALQLGLLWLSSVSQTSLGAYFLRRDLFGTIASFIQTPSTSVFAFESSLFIGMLATVGQGSSSSFALGSSTSNPYARRLRDWVDNQCMQRILVAAAAALKQGVEQYVEVLDDTPPSIAGSIAGLASLRWMSGIGEMVGMSSSASSSSVTSGVASSGRKTNAVGLDFGHLPPPALVVLLPIFLLARSNQAFTSQILSGGARSGGEEDAAEVDENHPYTHLLSISSYLCTHASSSPRSRSYARISLLLLLVLLYDPIGVRTALDDSDACTRLVQQVRICRQREPALALARQKRTRLITSSLDVATCHLRYNLSKRLDVGSYLLSLKLVQRSIALCGMERIALEYDWADTWSSLLALAAFVAGRHAEMRVSTDLGQLVRAIIATLNTALIRSDHFLASPRETQALIYELVRSSHVLRGLVRIADPSLFASSPAEPPVSGSTAASTGAIPTPPKLYALLPGYRNIERVILAIEAQIADWVSAKPSSRRNKTPDIATVTRMVAALDLEALLAGAEDEDAAGAALPAATEAERARHHADLEWLDKMQEGSLAEFVRWSCADIVRILPIY